MASNFRGPLGGLLMLRLGINRALWVFGAIQMVSILGFVWLRVGAQLWVLATVIAFEYLGVGLGTAAFTAFIARSRVAPLPLHSLHSLPRSRLCRGLSRMHRPVLLWESTGWVSFFLLCTVLAMPGMVALIWVAPWRSDSQQDQAVGQADK